MGVSPLDDRLARAIGIPAFGLAIPRLTSLFHGTSPRQAIYWMGTVAFLALAAAIWEGNRWLLFEQRRHVGWFDHPIRKIVMLLAAIVLFTVPLTVVALLGWSAWSGVQVGMATLSTVTLVNVLCVVFVTHVYETVFLIKERSNDLLRVAALDRARAEAELAAFEAQLDPHFLFNSLGALDHLIETDPPRARRFNDGLCDLYRYLLRQRGQTTVPLSEELAFVDAYVELMRVRLGDALTCRVQGDLIDVDARRIPPTALQLLVENAVKHNEVGEGLSLCVDIHIGSEEARVSNARRPRRHARASAGIGLQNLDERMRLVAGRGIEVDQREGRFAVSVPLVPQEA